MFFLIKKKLEPYLALIKLVLRSAIAIALVVMWFSIQHYKGVVEKYKVAEALQAEKDLAQLATFEAEKARIELKWAKERIKSHEEYTAEIQRINDMHASRMHDVSRVRDSTKEIIKYLPDYSREALENVTKTTTDGVSECATLLAEVESVAWGYSAEIDKLIKEFPTVEPVTDKKTE